MAQKPSEVPKKPRTINELFSFYYDTVKPLYNMVQTLNHPSVEMLFELNAALDHISRHWTYGEDEEKVVEKAYSHFKRACLDAYKLKFKEIRDEYVKLSSIDTGVIDNGKFDTKYLALYDKIRKGAEAARMAEGNPHDEDGKIVAFDLWFPVFNQCVEFQDQFSHHKAIPWAKKKQKLAVWAERGWSFGINVVAGLFLLGLGSLLTLLVQYCQHVK